MGEHIRSRENTEQLLDKLKQVNKNVVEIEYKFDKTSIPIYECPEQFRGCGLPTDLVAVIHHTLENQKGDLRLLSSKAKRAIAAGNFRKEGLPNEVVNNVISYAKELSENDFFALVQYSKLQGNTDGRNILELRLSYPQIDETELYARITLKKGRSGFKNDFVDLTDCLLNDRDGTDISEEIQLRIESPLVYTIRLVHHLLGKNTVIYSQKERVLCINPQILRRAFEREIEYELFQQYPAPSKTETLDPEYVAQIIFALQSKSN